MATSRLSISEGINGLDYDNTTGVFSLTGGYNIPLTASTTNWNNTYLTVSASSSNWQTAYNWGNHANQTYYATNTGPLSSTYGGTGQDSHLWSGMARIMNGVWSPMSGITNSMVYWTSDGDISTSSGIYLNASGWLGVGTSSVVGLLTVGSSTGNQFIVDENGNVIHGRWLSDTPIDLVHGGTGTTTAAGVRSVLGMDNLYNYGVDNGTTSGMVWVSNGPGNRGYWAPLGSLGGSAGYSLFVGTTTVTMNGNFASGSLSGYRAGNAICDAAFAGSHFCMTYEIITTTEMDTDISDWGTKYVDAWIAEGPPGYTANSNDCGGYATSSSSYLGAHWMFGPQGGAGWLAGCNNSMPLACCKRQ